LKGCQLSLVDIQPVSVPLDGTLARSEANMSHALMKSGHVADCEVS